VSSRTLSVLHLLNEIREGAIVLPDLQRDFVWDQDQIRLLFDSIMRRYPFGSLLLWETRFLSVSYREFVKDYKRSTTFVPDIKPANKQMRMVLDGQQRLQSLYLGIFGSHEGKRLYFNVLSGPKRGESETDPGDASYQFEFRRDDETTNRPKRLVRVSDIIGWSHEYEDDEIGREIESIKLEGTEYTQAAKNMRLIRQVMTHPSLVLVETIDEEVSKPEQAKKINEILEIFVRVNSGGTRLSRSDLMFSLIKTRWLGAREAFDELAGQVDPGGILGIDKDFIIRGLLVISDAPVAFDVDTIERHWEVMRLKFDEFAASLKSAIDFCREPSVGILSASLLQPVATLYPLVYYLSRQRRGSVPDRERRSLRAVLYFLLFNQFIRGQSPQARIRWLRDVLAKSEAEQVPVDDLLAVIKSRQGSSSIETTVEMLNWNPNLGLNIVQPAVCRDSISWQVRAEVDHIFPQSVYREKYPELVDDIGNLAYLGKLRNIRKSAQQPWDYFAETPDEELSRDFLIERTLLAEDKFEEFVQVRREAVLTAVRNFLGR
jgi:hypothetical protein